MDISFTTKLQPKPPEQVVGEFLNAIKPTPADLKEVGDWLVGRIRERTLSGTDIHDAPFAAYTPRYAAKKGSEQVNLFSAARAAKSSAQMDLFEHGPGHMLDSLSTKIGTSDSGGMLLEVGIIDNAGAARRGRMLQEGWQPRGHVGKRYKKGKMKGKFRARPARVPPREWLGATDDDRVEMRNVLEEAIATRIGRGE